MPRLTGAEASYGLIRAFLPDDVRVSAVLGHPLHAALAALWEDRSSESVPIEGVVRTTRAHCGDLFYEEFSRSPESEREYRDDLERAVEEGGFEQAREDGLQILWLLRERYAEPEFRPWVQTPPPQRNLVRTYDELTGELKGWRTPHPQGLGEETTDSQKATGRLLSATADRLRNIDIWGLEWQAEALTEGVREDSWGELREIAGQASLKGRTAHPEVLSYWKDTRKRLSGIIQDRRSEYEEAGALWWQLWKPERELVDAGTLQDFTPSEVAAYLLWERAGRRKTLVTFARHMGVSLRKDTAEEMVDAVDRELRGILGC